LRSFAKDDEGEGAGGTGTSHVVVTAPVVVRDRVVGGDCVGLDDANDIWSVTWPPTTPKKIPLHTRVPANDVARSAMSLLHHYALAAVREGNKDGGGRGRGKSPLFFFLK
jgi:hypothetical protein